jgi:hypothetical protein
MVEHTAAGAHAGFMHEILPEEFKKMNTITFAGQGMSEPITGIRT